MLASEELLIPDISYVAGRDQVTQGLRNLDQICNSLDVVEQALSDTKLTEPLFNLGSDCGGELIPVALLNAKYQGNLRVIWFDAHPDLNTVETSGSHTFHGMVLRMLLGDIPQPLSKYLQVPLKPENVVLAGVRDIDSGEQECIDANKMTLLHPDALAKAPTQSVMEQLADAPVFVHVDYDVLDPERHSNTAFGAKNGVALDDLLSWLSFIRSTFNVVGYGLTEFAPSSALSDDTDLQHILRDGFGLNLSSTYR
ncbi:arginase [Pseudovibrio sp. JE062]|nr:arginase [Pseudovibrio sp. JE062]